jgi:DNA-directed RNA polymerase specialized sigma24 family protein
MSPTMPISAATLDRARKLSAPAVEEVLRENYPSVHRLAHGLAGSADVGAGIVRYVMHRSIAILPTWREELAPENWFHRFTVITARRTIRHQPDPRTDVLLGDTGVAPDPAYIAFIAALRALPRQQQEAFILYTCEHLGPRTSSIAMDCSTEAAGNHLRAATDALRSSLAIATRRSRRARPTHIAAYAPPRRRAAARASPSFGDECGPSASRVASRGCCCSARFAGAIWVVHTYKDRVEI